MIIPLPSRRDGSASSLISTLLSYSTLLFLGGGLGEVCKGFTALELGVLDHACCKVNMRCLQKGRDYILASASLEKLPVQVMNV
jgi:hypothetical protein